METLFYGFVFWLGGTVYQSIELWWRRRTHPSMFLAGGLAAVLLEFLCNGIFYALPLPLKCLLGGLTVTAVEFSVGCVVNLRLGLAVWDYTHRRGHILGQICPLYSALWVILSLPALLVLDFLHRLIG